MARPPLDVNKERIDTWTLPVVRERPTIPLLQNASHEQMDLLQTVRIEAIVTASLTTDQGTVGARCCDKKSQLLAERDRARSWKVVS